MPLAVTNDFSGGKMAVEDVTLAMKKCLQSNCHTEAVQAVITQPKTNRKVGR